MKPGSELFGLQCVAFAQIAKDPSARRVLWVISSVLLRLPLQRMALTIRVSNCAKGRPSQRCRRIMRCSLSKRSRLMLVSLALSRLIAGVVVPLM